MSNGLFKRSGVRFEVACDVIGAVISHHAEVIATELDKAAPDQAVIAAAEVAKKALRDTRESLDTNDVAGIEAAITNYGAQARALYESTGGADHGTEGGEINVNKGLERDALQAL
jgi:hypothetical protein